MLPEIKALLREKNLLDNELTFFDAFSGTGSVANHLKGNYNLIINDLLQWCVVYSRGRIAAETIHFDKLGFDPIDYLNSTDEIFEGFFYKNYSPGGSDRMYLSQHNAGRVDYIRKQIDLWRRADSISDDEECYLLACLIESVSLVANVAGVYGAFLKHWDPRALKDLKLVRLQSGAQHNKDFKYLNRKLEDIIEQTQCDIIYLDPPYTQNQYGTQYHLLETLVLNDTPEISKITGSRPTAPMRSDWSKEYKAHILFDRIVAKTKAKYVIFSYSTDGIMSKDFIEAILKRYGKEDSYVCKKVTHKRYGNHKAAKKEGHSEYLFFIEKRDPDNVHYESPLNYIGSKAKMVDTIKANMPETYGKFVDAFGGGFNVGINILGKEVVYNDNNYFVKDLVESFRSNDTYQYLLYIRKMIKKFGLTKSDSAAYIKAREFYNSKDVEARDPRMLYTVLLYGFQQQLRFNGKHDFNNPVGMRWFNDRVLAKMISFSRRIKEGNYSFKAADFLELEESLNEGDFVYMDPPYMLTRGSYNDGKRGFGGWDQNSERRMLEFCERLNQRNVRFMISYVVEHGGECNEIVSDWISANDFRVIEVRHKNIRRKEILVVNYYNNEATFYNQKQFSKATRPLLRSTNVRDTF